MGSVDLVGSVPDEELAQWYRRSSLFAMPSDQEGLAIVGLEAMASGLPVVSTRCGGPQDYVKEGKNGYLVDVDDEKGMARRIVKLLERPGLRAKMGRAGRRLVEEQYSFPDFCRRIDDVYASVWPEICGR